MKTSTEYDIFRQPPAASPENLLANAVITWEIVDGRPTVVSRYRDQLWIWPATGSLSTNRVAGRSIDFELMPQPWRALAKQFLFACLRHPKAGQRGLSFYSLRHKFYQLRRLVELADSLGLSRLADLTKPQVESFLRTLTAKADHLESVVGQLIAAADINRMFKQGLIDDGIAFNVAGVRSSKQIARSLWKDVHGKDFDYETEGYQPHNDDDTEEMLSTAFFYVRQLARPLLQAHREITRIWTEHDYWPGKRNGSKTRTIPPIVRAMLESLFDEQQSSTFAWPPRESKDVGIHVRMLQGLCILIIAFFTLARRSELVALKAHDCLTPNDDGEFVLHGRIFKGEDDLEGRPASWPVPTIVAEAVTVLQDIREAISLRSLRQTGRPLEHEALLTNHASRRPDEDKVEDRSNDDGEVMSEFGPLRASGIPGITRDLKAFLFPDLVGSCALHRLRKTAVRLVALTVEGSSLVLKNVLHHDNPRTTLHYMFASPMMQQELAAVWPEISVSNLRELYSHRQELAGPGVANLSIRTSQRSSIACAQTEVDRAVTEEEFVSLGAEMMEKGHMLLTRLGVGVWCLKPALEKGKCNEGTQDIIPNGGRCSVQCRFHIQDGRRTDMNLRDLADIDQKLALSDLSKPIRALYNRYRAELVSVIPKDKLPA